MIRKDVLVVEDDRDILENLTTALELEGYEVFAAENGQVALNHLKSLSSDHIPGCILLDMMMPVMDGESFAKHLLNDYPDTLAQIPIVVVTAKGGGCQVLQNLPLKIECLPKPIRLEQLLQTVERHCEVA